MLLIDIFRENIKFYRFAKKYSQQQLGEMSGLSTHYISDIERGRYSPNIYIIERIAEALEIPPHLLFIDNPEAKKLLPRVDMHRKNSKKK